MPKHKRNRGGQPGNQNARKHGLYSNHLTSVEIEALGLEPLLDPAEIPEIVLRNKTLAALNSRPGDPRVIREVLHRTYDYLFSRYPASPADKRYVKKYFRQAFRAVKEYSTQLAGTIQPQFVSALIESVCRNDSSLNPQKAPESAVTIEAAKTRFK
jgi:hypothetical protein